MANPREIFIRPQRFYVERGGRVSATRTDCRVAVGNSYNCTGGPRRDGTGGGRASWALGACHYSVGPPARASLQKTGPLGWRSISLSVTMRNCNRRNRFTFINILTVKIFMNIALINVFYSSSLQHINRIPKTIKNSLIIYFTIFVLYVDSAPDVSLISSSVSFLSQIYKYRYTVKYEL